MFRIWLINFSLLKEFVECLSTGLWLGTNGWLRQKEERPGPDPTGMGLSPSTAIDAAAQLITIMEVMTREERFTGGEVLLYFL